MGGSLSSRPLAALNEARLAKGLGPGSAAVAHTSVHHQSWTWIMKLSDAKFLEATRKAEVVLAEALLNEFPKHYYISQRLLRTPDDTEPFLRKLGRFLLAYDQELGEIPALALSEGRSEQLLHVWANRANVDVDSIELTTIPVRGLAQNEEPEKRPVYLAYCNYYATGEGVSLMVGAGNTPSSARKAFLDNTHEYFHQGLTEDCLEDSSPPETRRAARMLSEHMTNLIASLPNGAPQFYARIHYNLS